MMLSGTYDLPIISYAIRYCTNINTLNVCVYFLNYLYETWVYNEKILVDKS